VNPQIEITDQQKRRWRKTKLGFMLIDTFTDVIPIQFSGNIFPAGNFKKKKK
jgi:hypothetical protein